MPENMQQDALAANASAQCGLVINYDPATKQFSWKIQGAIPVLELVGILDLVKSFMIDEQKARIKSAQVQDKILTPARVPFPKF